ncbi:hypothetical protein NDU88_007021 [Pleurodeles waltl]|uniref:Uncharacterized protein n=1 Tax=Pleurodeles waltl TaxID=8319 RepID=A0AAV7PK16_PLEWA|nr:hypothetical protein NDU88_007021 [Pleurodeles waltl]
MTPKTRDMSGVGPGYRITAQRSRNYPQAEDAQGDGLRTRWEPSQATEKPSIDRRRGHRIPPRPRRDLVFSGMGPHPSLELLANTPWTTKLGKEEQETSHKEE